MQTKLTSPLLAGALGLAAVVALGACDNGGGGNGGGQASPGIDKFNQPGPNAVRTVSTNGYTLFLGNGSGPKPGLTWANGTGGSPTNYTDILRRVASFGTQVVASNSPQTGNGQAVADGVGVLRGADSTVTTDFCTSGHSQGGSGSINAARIIAQRGTANVRCTIPVQPDNVFTASSNGGDIRGLGLILCGSADGLAPCDIRGQGANGNGLFNQSQRPTVEITVVGAGHTGPGSPAGGNNGGLYPALVTAGIEAAIDGDPAAIAAVASANPDTAQDGRFTLVRSKGF